MDLERTVIHRCTDNKCENKARKLAGRPYCIQVSAYVRLWRYLQALCSSAASPPSFLLPVTQDGIQPAPCVHCVSCSGCVHTQRVCKQSHACRLLLPGAASSRPHTPVHGATRRTAPQHATRTTARLVLRHSTGDPAAVSPTGLISRLSTPGMTPCRSSCRREQATAQLKATRAGPEQTRQMMEVLQRLQQQQPGDSYDGSSSSDAGSSSDGGDSDASLEGPAGKLYSIPPALTRLLKRVSKHGKAHRPCTPYAPLASRAAPSPRP